MKPVSKEEFSVILERQQESGLSIKDFCSNESYTVSSFHYWKSKFGFTRNNNTQHRQSLPDKLAPVNINLPVIHIPADSRPLIPVILGHLVRDFSV